MIFLNKFLTSKSFLVIIFLFSVIVFALKKEVFGLISIIILASTLLLIIDDIMPVFYCVLIIGAMVLRLYNSFNLLIPFIWVIPFPILAIVFHFILYKGIKRDKSMIFPYLVVSLSLILGGLFSISTKDYFTSTALYYTLGGGVGLLAFYVLLQKYFNPKQSYNSCIAFSHILTFVGLFCVSMLIIQYIKEVFPLLKTLGDFIPSKYYTDLIIGGKLQLGNNLSTTLLITMPFSFYLVKINCGIKSIIYFVIGILQSFSMILSMSRGGLIFGIVFTLALVFCIFYLEKSNVKKVSALFLTFISLFVLLCLTIYLNVNIWAKLFNVAFLFYEMQTKTLYIFFALIALLTLLTMFLIYAFVAPKKAQKNIFAILTSVFLFFIIIMFIKWDFFYKLFLNFDYFRAEMANIAIKNFYKYPIFGTGIGYTGLRHIYLPKQGMLDCYHCAFFQIIGSLGLLGFLAYGYMFLKQLKLLTEKRSYFNIFVFTAILGLYFMSMLNPGFFMPVIFGISLSSLIFISEINNKSNSKIDF